MATYALNIYPTAVQLNGHQRLMREGQHLVQCVANDQLVSDSQQPLAPGWRRTSALNFRLGRHPTLNGLMTFARAMAAL